MASPWKSPAFPKSFRPASGKKLRPKPLLLKPVSILGIRVDRPTLPEIIARLERGRAENKPVHIVTVNALMLLDCAKNPALQSILQESSLNVPESSGLSWAARMKSIKPFPRLPGIDLLQELCREGNQKGWSIYLWGSAPGVAEEAKERLSRNYPNLKIVGASHGYLKGSEENEALETIKRLKPHLLFVGMGSPRQEEWIQKHSSFFPGIGVMGVGGSFDVISGRLPRAPKLFQALGIEWLYRWAREPWRTLRMLRLPLFLIKAVLHPDPSSKTD